MGKTETIKQRRVEVWLPTIEAKERWAKRAADQGVPLSRLVFEMVEESLSGGSTSADVVDEMSARISDLQEELGRREARIHELETLKDRLEEDLEAYRTQDILRPGGKKVLDHRLISVLSESRGRTNRPRVVPEEELLRRLQIKKGSDQMQALALQLEALELHGLVKATAKGWIWGDK